jgi:hypothetical protein
MSTAPTPPTPRAGPPAWLCIVAAGILAHGVVLLTDYVLWDGWWYVADLGRPDGPTVMARLFHEVGRPLDLWFYEPLRRIGGDPVVAAKWLGVAAWIASSVCIAAVLRELALLHPSVAMAVAMLVATLPVFDLLGEIALWMNTACVLLFWLAWVLVSRLPHLTGWWVIAVRVSALALFFVAFNLNSNLVMFYAVAVAIAGLRLPDLRPATLRARLPRVMARHADFLTLPVVFWLWKTLFTPSSGFYATGYNQPSLAPDRLLAGYLGLARDFVFRGLVGFFWSPAWVVFAFLVVSAATLAIRRSSICHQIAKASQEAGLRLFGWGAFLLLAAAFPYVVVGQALATEGWLTRNCILCPLPVALMIVGALVFVNRRWVPRHPTAWFVGGAMMVVIGVGGSMHNYFRYQALGTKCLSIRDKLSAVIRESSPAMIQLRDYCPVPHTIPYYPPAIWTFLANDPTEPPRTFVLETAMIAPDVVQQGPDGQPRVAIPVIPMRSSALDEAITATTMPYALERVPRRGPQLLASIRPGYGAADAAELGRRAIAIRWLEPASLAAFVERFTTLETTRLPDVE